MLKHFTMLAALAATAAFAQTQIPGNLVFQGSIDASDAKRTAPIKSGTTANRPATCSGAEMYFATDAAAGQNIYVCTPSTGAWAAQSSASGTTGAGSANYVAKWSGAAALTNSTIYESGGSVGIGTASPNATLEVNGNAYVNNQSGYGALKLSGSLSGNVAYSLNQAIPGVANTGFAIRDDTNSTNRIVINGTGYVGIAIGSPTVSGTGRFHAAGNTARSFDTARTPATSAEACNVGESAFDSTYLYVCTAANTWKRISLTAF